MIPGKTSFSLKILAKALKKEKRALFAYVYGSVLKRRDARDIDIAIFLRGTTDYWSETQEMAGRLEKSLNYSRKIDAHTLNCAAVSFAFEIIKTGRLLFERGLEERLNWEAHALSRYQDIKPMLDFHDRRFLRR